MKSCIASDYRLKTSRYYSILRFSEGKRKKENEHASEHKNSKNSHKIEERSKFRGILWTLSFVLLQQPESPFL